MFSPSIGIASACWKILKRDKYVAERWIMYQRTTASKKGQCAVFGQQNSRGGGWQGDLSAQEMNYDSDLEVSNAHLHSAYQRSFSDNLGWGWHWYRSSLRRKAPGATESDLALLLTFWALFLTERTTTRAGTRYVFALPWSITYHLSEGIALRV